MYKVVLIEDDPMVQEVNRQFIEQVSPFRVVGISGNGVDGMEMVRNLQPDLVIIDIYMPLKDGIETIQTIRSEKLEVDVIAITAANDIETVRRMLQNGVFDYIMKPFKFERLKQTLEHYHTFRQTLKTKEKVTQKELDSLFQLETDVRTELPKGLNDITLKKIVDFLQQQTVSVSAEEVAEGVGIARVTARRYLEYLEKERKVQLDVQYGGIGRPVNRYIKRP